MKYIIIPVTTFLQNCSIIWCEQTKMAALVDPGGDTEKIKQKVLKAKIVLTKILLTHGHIDHVGSAIELSQYYKIPIFGPEKKDEFWLQCLPEQSRMFGFKKCESFIPNYWLNEGNIISVGNISLCVLHSPGHTPGHISFFAEKSNLLISGDLIFKNSIGRSDFPYSNYTMLINSIKNKLLPLGDNITFIPGHGPTSTLGYERLHNSFL